MIPPEVVARIRRLFYAEHWKVGTIAAEVGVHHDTVMRAIEAERFLHSGAQVRPTLLDGYKDFIVATLGEHPRLRATRIYEMVRDRGFPGSARQVRRYVATVRPAPRAEAYLRAYRKCLSDLPVLLTAGAQAALAAGNPQAG